MNKNYLFALIILLSGCTSKDTHYPLSFKTQISHHKDIRYSKLSMDSVVLDSIPSSYLGETWIKNNSIYFIDKKFCFVDKFTLDGKFINRFVGQGDGKNELPIKTMILYSPLDNGGLLIIGGSWDCYLFDSNFVRRDDYGINWHATVTKEAMLKNPDASQTKLYSVYPFDFRISSIGNFVYIPIVSQHPQFNPTNPTYFNQARTLALMNVENGYIEKIFGGFSPKYIQSRNASTFPYHFLALTDANTLQIAYPPDSLIYVADKNFTIKSVYGFAGRDMDTSYTNVNEITLFRQNYAGVLNTKGYYNGLKYIPECGLLFRSYTKNATLRKDGLQIYKNDTLIADLEVPRDFRVESYHVPYFYSNASIDEDKSTIKIYKFKLTN